MLCENASVIVADTADEDNEDSDDAEEAKSLQKILEDLKNAKSKDPTQESLNETDDSQLVNKDSKKKKKIIFV